MSDPVIVPHTPSANDALGKAFTGVITADPGPSAPVQDPTVPTSIDFFNQIQCEILALWQGWLTTRTVATSGLILATDDVIFASLPSGAITLTLPDAATCDGKQYRIKNCDIGVDSAATEATIDSAGGLIDGSLTVVLGPLASVRVISDGSDWWILD
jgi:hypothetical protein